MFKRFCAKSVFRFVVDVIVTRHWGWCVCGGGEGGRGGMV